MMKTIKSLLLLGLVCMSSLAFSQNALPKTEDNVHMDITFTSLDDIRYFDAYESFEGLESHWGSDTIKIRLTYQPDLEEMKKMKLAGDKNKVTLTVTEHYENIAEEVNAAKEGIINVLNKLKK